MKNRKCNCWNGKEDKKKKYCNKPFYKILKVQVFHPDSLRRSWQTWYMCEEHFEAFIQSWGKGWGCEYRDKKKPFAPLINFKILSDLNPFN